MASRIFWVLLAGAALVTGIVVQDGGQVFSWGHDSDHRSRTIEAKVDRAIDRSLDRTEVVTVDGREIHVSREQKNAMADAIGRLVKAEGEIVALKIRGASDDEIRLATTERDKARTDMEQIKAQMNAQKDAERSDRDQIREEVRESIRHAVRG